MNKVLFLSYCMPPLKYPRSIQISRLIKNMKIKPSVIYANESTNLDYSILEDFDSYVNDKIQIKMNNNRYLNFIKRKIFPILYSSPDPFVLWSDKLFKIASQYLEKNKHDKIVTFGEPMSVHLAGLRLKKFDSNLKWIAHFSDPWLDNPLKNRNFLVRKINAYLERKVFENADKLIFTSEETILMLKQKYPEKIANKLIYLPHSYDENCYEYKKTKNSKFTIRYIGGFYSGRSPKPLLEAITKIAKINSSILDNVLFEIVGNLGRYANIMNKYNTISKYVSVRKNVTYQESLNLMTSSDVLLVIDAESDESIFFPSKLADYIGSKKPIIGITPNGTSKNIISRLDGKSANPGNVEDIILMVKDILANKNKYRNFEVNEEYLKFDAVNITEDFENILYSV